jgi:predicted phosphoribosyltransferase
VFEKNTDEFVYLIASKDFRGVGRFYEDFQQVEDDEVIQMLKTTHPLANNIHNTNQLLKKQKLWNN